MKYKVNFDIELLKNPYKGTYIALEGIDGCGKTTQAQLLADYFKSKGKDVVLTREPRKSGVIGDLVQDVLLGKTNLPPVAYQYLFSADRAAHHEELVIPALKKGKIVITDRSFWSAVVYGILDKTGGKYNKKTLNQLLIAQSILSMYHQFIVPDYNFYLRISLETSMKRLKKSSDEKEIYEDKSKIKKILGGYEYLLKNFPKEFTILSGEGNVEETTKALIDKIKKKK